MIAPTDMATFWREVGPKKWFAKDDAFDAELRARFLDAHFAAARRELDDWMHTPDGALSLVLLLDQVPRNVFRGTAHQFATDPLAHHFADAAVTAGHDAAIEAPLRVFFYLPFEHAETQADQTRAVALTTAIGDEAYTKFARLHADIIARFGRFPHRNAALGRESTAEETAFLEAGGFAG